MKQAKRILAVALAALMIAVSVPYVFAASLNYTSKSIYYGQSLTLKVKGGTASAWTSSNKSVATVDSKGVVKGVGIGRTVIRATVGSQKLSCNLAVKDRETEAVVSFKTSTGGAFIYKVNTATIKVKPQKNNVGRAVVKILDAADEEVYRKTMTKLTKNKTVSFSWNGRDNDNSVVPNGTYTVTVQIRNTISKSDSLVFARKNYFAAGDGSKKNPFQVATTGQLKQIVRYPNAYFKQTKNLNFNYASVGGFFTEDQPFNGVYDGCEKKIVNVSATVPLINYVGEKGTIKNVIIEKGTYLTVSPLVDNNAGKITNCKVSANISKQETNGNTQIGLICRSNAATGVIANCRTSGTATATATAYQAVAYVGGIAGQNYGKIISCTANVNVSADATNNYWGGIKDGGIAAYNGSSGFIQNCEAKGTIGETNSPGGIAGTNDGQISGCVYNGKSSVSLAADGTGIVS